MAAKKLTNILAVPARNDLPWYKFKIALDGVLFTMHFMFNSWMGVWMVDINDASDNPIINGIPALINRDLFGQYVTLNIPPGVMFCTDDTGNNTQPGQFSFGVDHTLFYGAVK